MALQAGNPVECSWRWQVHNCYSSNCYEMIASVIVENLPSWIIHYLIIKETFLKNYKMHAAHIISSQYHAAYHACRALPAHQG